jgi:hypothetical protein
MYAAHDNATNSSPLDDVQKILVDDGAAKQELLLAQDALKTVRAVS